MKEIKILSFITICIYISKFLCAIIIITNKIEGMIDNDKQAYKIAGNS